MMSVFADQLLLRFLQDAFVNDLLTNQLGLTALFNLTYELEDADLNGVTLGAVRSRQFQTPAFETIRTSGIHEQIMPTPERVKIDRAQPRYGRLAWVDVLLDVMLTATVKSKAMPLESITSQNLLDKLGGVASLVELKNKLANFYTQSIVDAFFKKLRITSVDDFKNRPTLFLEFVYQAPPPFNPLDPQNVRNYQLNVCVQFQADLKVVEAMQSAKLCRSILENERDYVQTIDGEVVDTPYVFVVIFADSVVQDNALSGLTAVQIKSSIKNLFQSERMLAHFL